MTDNVINFPSNKTEKEDKLYQELQDKGVEVVLDRVEKNRKLALERLETLVDKLDKAPEGAPLTTTIRDTISALKATLLGLEALDSYASMLAHDISYLGLQNDKTNHNLFEAGGHLQVLIHLLIEKDFITKEEMLKIWKEKILPEAMKDIEQVVGSGQDPSQTDDLV